MNALRKSLIVLFVFALMGVMVVPALATDTRTKTVTEDQVNSSYRVTNPWRRSITDVSVDLQPGQVVVYSTHTYRGGASYEVVSTAVPSVSNGRIFWDVTSVSANGSAIPADLLQQINDWMDASWRNYFKSQNPGRIVSVEITDVDATVTYQTGRR